VCSYVTEKFPVSGSGKGAAGWFGLSDAMVYFDHPVHAPAEHTLNIDFLNPAAGPAARVAVELDAGSARALARSILSTLDGAGAQAKGDPGLPAGSAAPSAVGSAAPAGA
jgi:hypothetical protein